MTSNQGTQTEEVKTRPSQAGRLMESIQMAERAFPRLVELYVNNGDRVNFTDLPKCDPDTLFANIRDAVLELYPQQEFFVFMNSIQYRSIDDKIMECLVKVMDHVTNYMKDHERFFREATNWFTRNSTTYYGMTRLNAFYFVQGAFTDIGRYNDGVRQMADQVARYRELVEKLCAQYVIPELHYRPFQLVPNWRARMDVRAWLAKVRQFEFECEMLATQYSMMLVQSLVGFWQSA